MTELLDRLVRQETSFRSWASLVEDMERTGYVPTLWPEDAGAMVLRHALCLRGLRVWPAARA